MIKVSLTRNAVMSECIKHDWYTRGTNSDYVEMLDYVQAVFGVYGDTYVNITTAETAIKKVVSNIIVHTDVERIMAQTGCGYDEIHRNIEFVLLNDAATYQFRE